MHSHELFPTLVRLSCSPLIIVVLKQRTINWSYAAKPATAAAEPIYWIYQHVVNCLCSQYSTHFSSQNQTLQAIVKTWPPLSKYSQTQTIMSGPFCRCCSDVTVTLLITDLRQFGVKGRQLLMMMTDHGLALKLVGFGWAGNGSLSGKAWGSGLINLKTPGVPLPKPLISNIIMCIRNSPTLEQEAQKGPHVFLPPWQQAGYPPKQSPMLDT